MNRGAGGQLVARRGRHGNPTRADYSISGRILMRANSARTSRLALRNYWESCSFQTRQSSARMLSLIVPESMSMVFSRTDKHMRYAAEDVGLHRKPSGADGSHRTSRLAGQARKTRIHVLPGASNRHTRRFSRCRQEQEVFDEEPVAMIHEELQPTAEHWPWNICIRRSDDGQ